MPKSVGVYLRETTLKRLDELAVKNGRTRSQVLEELLAFALDKKQALETKQSAELLKLKFDIISEMESRFNSFKNDLSLELAYRIEKLEDEISEIKLDDYLDELLWSAIYIRSIITRFLAKKAIDKSDVEEMKKYATDMLNKFKERRV